LILLFNILLIILQIDNLQASSDNWLSTEGVIDCPFNNEAIIVFSEDNSKFNCEHLQNIIDENIRTDPRILDDCNKEGKELWFTYWENGTYRSTECVFGGLNCYYIKDKGYCVARSIYDENPLSNYYRQFQDVASNQVFQQYGVAGLFINALLSATAIPIPTEILTASLLVGGESPIIIGVVLLAGSSIGGFLNYLIGFGGNKLFSRFRRSEQLQLPSEKEEQKKKEGHKWLKKLGWSGVFFAPFIPVAGDFILISAGATRRDFKKFMIIMFTGKTVKVVITVLGLGVIF